MHIFNLNQGPVSSICQNFNRVARPVIKNISLISGVALFILACLAAGGLLSNLTFGGYAIALGTVTLLGTGKSLYDSGHLCSTNKILLACLEGNLIVSGAMAMISFFTPISLIATSILIGVAGSMQYNR